MISTGCVKPAICTAVSFCARRPVGMISSERTTKRREARVIETSGAGLAVAFGVGGTILLMDEVCPRVRDPRTEREFRRRQGAPALAADGDQLRASGDAGG